MCQGILLKLFWLLPQNKVSPGENLTSWCTSSVAYTICCPDFHSKALKFQCVKNKISLFERVLK